MRYLSICSGIEATSLAWEPLGWRPVGFAEVDPFASAVLAHRWPSVPNLGDVTTLAALWGGFGEPRRQLTFAFADVVGRWDRGTTIDLLVGGTPCQSFSIAGRRGGLADPRGQLAFAFADIARAVVPRWVVWENVPGVLSADRGWAFAVFVRRLVDLGYGVAWRVLDASGFGVPQRRRRLFVVGCLGDGARARAVLALDESGPRDFAAAGANRIRACETPGRDFWASAEEGVGGVRARPPSATSRKATGCLPLRPL